MNHSIRRVVVGAGLAGGLFVLPGAAHAGPCDPVTKYTQQTWGQLNQIADEACKEGGGCDNTQAKLQKLYAQVDKVVKWWNQMMRGTWAQLGPRNYDFGAIQRGTLVAPGDRTWISTMPSTKDSVEVRVKKTDGKGFATAYVCAADSGGQSALIDQFEVRADGMAKKKVSGVAGKLVTVRLDGQGGAGKKVAYELEVE